MTPALALTVIIAMALTAAVAWWIVAPLRRGVALSMEADPHAVALLARREAALATLRDVEADYRSGRISQSDYEEVRLEAIGEGAIVLSELDRLAENSQSATESVVAQIEAEVQELLGEQVPGRRISRVAVEDSVAPGECAACGAITRSGDAFCARCGAAIGSGDAS
jgi:hypothetical protein